MASLLDIGKSTPQKWLSQYRQEINGQASKTVNALIDDFQKLREESKRVSMYLHVTFKGINTWRIDDIRSITKETCNINF